MANTEQALNKAREALQAMRNLGVPLNDHDSAALDTLCDFAESTLTAASAEAATPVIVPPSHWDEWALHRSRKLIKEMEEVNHPRAQLIARVHCLLIDAMQYAAPQASHPIGQPEHERDMLASAIRDVAVSAGICREDAYLTGPHLLMLCADVTAYIKHLEAQSNSQPVSGAGMTDEEIDAFVRKVCDGDPSYLVEPGEYLLTTDDIRAILSASGQAGQGEGMRCADCGSYTLEPIPADADCALAATPAQQTEAPVNVPIGCSRSHPHEEMSAECQRKTVEARIANADAQSATVQKGFTLVPTEPTDAMLHELAVGWDSCSNRLMSENYRAMLAAAPASVQTEAQQSEKITDLLEELRQYVENDSIETISPVTHRKHEEWRESKLKEIDAAIAKEKANQKGGA